MRIEFASVLLLVVLLSETPHFSQRLTRFTGSAADAPADDNTITIEASGTKQVSNIKLQLGAKTILKGKARKDRERLYTFEATAGQKLTVRLISSVKLSSFSVNLQDRVEYETIAENRTSWSGKLPESPSGIYSIAVKTRGKAIAAFTLELTLR
jgi:hypothetical protein